MRSMQAIVTSLILALLAGQSLLARASDPQNPPASAKEKLAADAALTEIELNGWRLQQYIRAVDAQLGKPFKVVDDGREHWRAYRLDDEAYMVFLVHDDWPSYIQSIQLTGVTRKMLPFRGLMLGDPVAKVVASLGEPVRKVDIAQPKVVRYDYPDRNYSVEIDAGGRLYSILLNTREVLANVADAQDPWPSFEAAIRARDFAALSGMLRPDVEISRDGEVLAVERRYSDFAQRPDPAFVDALFGERGSVRAALQDHAPEGQVRISEHQGIGMVYKFPEDSALQEIVFFPYAQRFRAYEITFREPAARTQLGQR